VAKLDENLAISKRMQMKKAFLPWKVEILHYEMKV
jgi:hypothetical protein